MGYRPYWDKYSFSRCWKVILKASCGKIFIKFRKFIILLYINIFHEIKYKYKNKYYFIIIDLLF